MLQFVSLQDEDCEAFQKPNSFTFYAIEEMIQQELQQKQRQQKKLQKQENQLLQREGIVSELDDEFPEDKEPNTINQLLVDYDPLKIGKGKGVEDQEDSDSSVSSLGLGENWREKLLEESDEDD
jgi:hypothetical protein